MRSRMLLLCAALLMCVAPPVAHALSGQDRSFGDGGEVVHEIGDGVAVGAVAAQPDGSLVVAAWYYEGSPRAMLMRVRPDGSLDPSFGDGGVVRRPDVFGRVVDLELMPDGTVLALCEDFGDEATLFRVTPNGAPDTRWGIGGSVSVDHATAMAQDAQGRLLLVADDGEAVRRLRPDGTPDVSFGRGGTASVRPPVVLPALGLPTDPAWGPSELEDVAALADGRVVVVGASYVGRRESQVAVWRLTEDGALDSSFSGDGGLLLDVAGGGSSRAVEVDPLPGGTLLVAARRGATENATPEASLLRLTDDGRLDAGFGGAGEATRTSGPLFVADVLPAAGRTYLVGAGHGAPTGETVVSRYLADGTLDPTFGDGGSVRVDRAGSEFASAAALTRSGLTSIASTDSPDSVVLQRFFAEDPACTIVGTDGRDTLRGTDGDDVICGLAGNDVVHASGGRDVVLAGAGDDVVFTRDDDADVVDAGDGDDRCHADATDHVEACETRQP